MPKISIIVPVYNAEKNIRECVLAILAQKYTNIEVILVNDGSKDNSLSICRDFEMADNRIRVIDGQNAGVSCARNKGIEVATGEYIAFVDADDIVSENIYTELMNKAISGYDMVFCNYTEFNEDGYSADVDQITQFGNDSVESKLVVSRLISISEDALFGVVWRVLFRASLIKDKNISFTPGLTMAEDLQFLLKCLKHTAQVGLCSEHLYNFRVSNQSTTGKYMKKQDSDMRAVNDWMMEYVREFDDNKDLIASVEICMANTLILNVANVCKVSTPYTLFERIKYAYALTKEEKYQHALKVAVCFKNQIVKKRYSQMVLMLNHMAFVNVIFHSLKNKTLFKRGKYVDR